MQRRSKRVLLLDLPKKHGYVTRMITPENPTGEPGGGCHADPATAPFGKSARNLGKGWKVKAWMKPIFRYLVPAAIIFIYIYGMVTFGWK